MTLKVHVNQSCCHLSLGKSGFMVCVSGTEGCDTRNIDVVLLTTVPAKPRDFGYAKLGLTYPVWMALSERPQNMDLVHLFMGYTESWELPEGWKASPISSGWGLGACAWLVSNGPKSILVTDSSVCSVITDQCMYPPIGVIPNTPDYMATFTVSLIIPELDLGWLKSELCENSSPLIVSMDCVVDLVAAVVELAHACSSIAKPILIYGKYAHSQLMLLASMYEWLHPDLQVYIRKCVKFASDTNEKIEDPIVLFDLVRANRVVFASKPIKNEDEVLAVFCLSCDMYLSEKLAVVEGSRLVQPASAESLVAHYRPSQVLTKEDGNNKGEIIDAPSRESFVRSEADIIRVLKIRYDNVVVDSINDQLHVDVRSIGIRAVFGGNETDRILQTVDAYAPDIPDSELEPFIHLVT